MHVRDIIHRKIPSEVPSGRNVCSMLGESRQIKNVVFITFACLIFAAIYFNNENLSIYIVLCAK